MTERPCTRCGATLPLSEFPVNRRMRDGHSSWCRSCAVAATREWRASIRTEYNSRRHVHHEPRACVGCGLVYVPRRTDAHFCCLSCRVYHRQPDDPTAATWAAAHRNGHESPRAIQNDAQHRRGA
jgi:hypothetical protein